MTAQHGTRYVVTITLPGDMPALLDMLRYEGATVRDWSHGEVHRASATIIASDRYVVTIASPAYTPERWASFGIRPSVQSSY